MRGALMPRRGERLGDRNIDPSQPGSRKAMQRNDIAAVVADAQCLFDADFLGLGATGRQQRQRVVEGDPVYLVHVKSPFLAQPAGGGMSTNAPRPSGMVKVSRLTSPRWSSCT